MAVASKHALPWYRQPWPWFLIGLPASAVIAGGVTLWLAISTSDGLVVDDYYKQGLAVHQAMERSQRAVDLGLQAQMRLQASGFEIDLTGRAPGAVPERIRVTFSHPTRGGLDQSIVLEGSQGRFSGTYRELLAGRWDIQIEDEARLWRMNGAATLPAETEIRIMPTASQPVN